MVEDKNVGAHVSFHDYAVVACGTLNMELNYLSDNGFLDARKILYTKPGRHENMEELESQLVTQIRNAKQYYSQRIIVVYGGQFCYINRDNPERTIDTIIQEQGPRISRIKADYCVDMLVGAEERKKIAQGKKIYWLTPGWIEYRKYNYESCDEVSKKQIFSSYTEAIVLDAIGYWDKLMEKDPGKIMEFSDWMEIPLEAYKISLERFKSLLLEQIQV